MPRRFAFNSTTGVGDVYLPGSLMRDISNVPSFEYLPWLKLRPHVTLAAANAALEPIVRNRFLRESATAGVSRSSPSIGFSKTKPATP